MHKINIIAPLLGFALLLPATDCLSALAEQSPASSPTTAAALIAPLPSRTHRVLPGDTLWGLSRRYGIGLRILIALNQDRVPDPDLIRVGQILRLSEDEEAPSQALSAVETATSSEQATSKKKPGPTSSTRHPSIRGRGQARGTPRIKRSTPQPIASSRSAEKSASTAPRTRVAASVPPVKPVSVPSSTINPSQDVLSDLSRNALAHRRRSVLANLPTGRMDGNRLGAAKRGSCAAAGQKLVALLPDTNLGQTISDQPTFFWSMPELKPEWRGRPLRGRFRINAVDAEGMDVDPPLIETEFDAGPSGIGSLVVEQPLPPEQNLRWTLTIVCDPDEPDGNEFVRGWIRRVEPSPQLAAELETAGLIDYPAIYAKAGLWFDALKYLAAIRRQVGDEAIGDEWEQLLKQVELGAIANQPLTCRRGPEGAADARCAQPDSQ